MKKSVLMMILNLAFFKTVQAMPNPEFECQNIESQGVQAGEIKFNVYLNPWSFVSLTKGIQLFPQSNVFLCEVRQDDQMGSVVTGVLCAKQILTTPNSDSQIKIALTLSGDQGKGYIVLPTADYPTPVFCQKLIR